MWLRKWWRTHYPRHLNVLQIFKKILEMYLLKNLSPVFCGALWYLLCPELIELFCAGRTKHHWKLPWYNCFNKYLSPLKIFVRRGLHNLSLSFWDEWKGGEKNENISWSWRSGPKAGKRVKIPQFYSIQSIKSITQVDLIRCLL